jgi:hypothetical protein
LCTEEEGNPSCRVRSAISTSASFFSFCKPRGSATPLPAGWLP